MNTIKFESWDSAYPLHKGTDREQQAKSIALHEGNRIWHRSFEVKNLAEFEEWKLDRGWGAKHTTSYIPGFSPLDALEKTEKHHKEERPITFEYLTFFDEKGGFHMCIVFCCNCFIMNAEGQTVDSFAA